MSLSPETPQDHNYCRILDHGESTEKKVELGKRKSDEKSKENFIDDTGKSFSEALTRGLVLYNGPSKLHAAISSKPFFGLKFSFK